MRNKTVGVEAGRNKKTITFVIKPRNTSRPNYRHKQVPRDTPDERTMITVPLSAMTLMLVEYIDSHFSLSAPATAALSVT